MKRANVLGVIFMALILISCIINVTYASGEFTVESINSELANTDISGSKAAQSVKKIWGTILLVLHNLEFFLEIFKKYSCFFGMLGNFHVPYFSEQLLIL